LSIRKVEKTELCQHAQIIGCDFVFYDNYVKICNDHGVSPSRAALDAGLSKSTVSKWKSAPDSQPTGAAIAKLAYYFGITIAELLGEDAKENSLSEENLTEGEKELLALFRQVPTEHQPAVLQMLRSSLTLLSSQ
jgi:transcriptional regulator with XRE-family HTH domain